MGLNRMDISRCCCGSVPPPNYCCGELPAPAAMMLEMANWSTAFRAGGFFLGTPWPTRDEIVSVDFTPLNGTHVLDANYPLRNFNVSGTVYNQIASGVYYNNCAWGKTFSLPVTWTNQLSHVTRTDPIVVLVHLQDWAYPSSRTTGLYVATNVPTSYDASGTWYETVWSSGFQFESQGVSRYTSYPNPNFFINYLIQRTVVSLGSKCSEYDAEVLNVDDVDTTDFLNSYPNMTVASLPTFAVSGP